MAGCVSCEIKRVRPYVQMANKDIFTMEAAGERRREGRKRREGGRERERRKEEGGASNYYKLQFTTARKLLKSLQLLVLLVAVTAMRHPNIYLPR